MLSSSKSFLIRVFSLFIFAILSFAPAAAQFKSGFEATITDPSGAAIAGAQITITNQDTQVQASAVSDGQGYVHIRNLPLGIYRAEVKAPGFKTWVESDIKLEGDQVRTLFPKMAIGEQVTSVTVTAESESVDTYARQRWPDFGDTDRAGFSHDRREPLCQRGYAGAGCNGIG